MEGASSSLPVLPKSQTVKLCIWSATSLDRSWGPWPPPYPAMQKLAKRGAAEQLQQRWGNRCLVCSRSRFSINNKLYILFLTVVLRSCNLELNIRIFKARFSACANEAAPFRLMDLCWLIPAEDLGLNLCMGP